MKWNTYTFLPSTSLSAPVIDIAVKSPALNVTTKIPVMIDTGASRTALPLHILLNTLKLHPSRCSNARGFDERLVNCYLFVIQYRLEEEALKTIEVLGIPREFYGLLGHDILQHYILTCDGPRRRFCLEIEPSA